MYHGVSPSPAFTLLLTFLFDHGSTVCLHLINVKDFSKYLYHIAETFVSYTSKVVN